MMMVLCTSERNNGARTPSPPSHKSGGFEKKPPRAEEKVLLKLREKYLIEIRQWERLSNTLKEMEVNSQTQFQAREWICNMVSFIEPSSSEERSLTNSTHRRLVNDLLFQVKAQEAIIHGVSHLCDVAEALCSAQEERLKQQFIDLLIWESSPCELVAGLTG